MYAPFLALNPPCQTKKILRQRAADISVCLTQKVESCPVRGFFADQGIDGRRLAC
jgi:hypothetical protein